MKTKLEEAAESFAEKIQYDLAEYDEGGFLGIDEKLLAKKLVEFASEQSNQAIQELVQALNDAADLLEKEGYKLLPLGYKELAKKHTPKQ